METRNVTLTLEKAKEFYNSGSADLREVALQAYTKDELEIPEWKNIKTFEDACAAIGLRNLPMYKANAYEVGIGKHLVAIYKLDIICKALNKDWKPSLVKGEVFYPLVRFYPDSREMRRELTSHGWKIGKSFITDGKKYVLTGGDYCSSNYLGLTGFSTGSGMVIPDMGLLGCKSREIAEHMSSYFSKEIFEATYAHHADTYQWV